MASVLQGKSLFLANTSDIYFGLAVDGSFGGTSVEISVDNGATWLTLIIRPGEALYSNSYTIFCQASGPPLAVVPMVGSGSALVRALGESGSNFVRIYFEMWSGPKVQDPVPFYVAFTYVPCGSIFVSQNIDNDSFPYNNYTSQIDSGTIQAVTGRKTFEIYLLDRDPFYEFIGITVGSHVFKQYFTMIDWNNGGIPVTTLWATISFTVPSGYSCLSPPPIILSINPVAGTPPMNGTGCAGGLLNLYLNGDTTAFQLNIPVNLSGNWSIAATAISVANTDVITARQTCPDGFGGVLGLSNNSNLATVVEPSPPPTVAGVIFEGDSELHGTGCPNATIWVYDGSTLIGQTTANAAGYWELVGLPLSALILGHLITAKQQCVGFGLSPIGNLEPVIDNPNADIDPTGVTYLNSNLSRNPIIHNIDAADPALFPFSPVNMRGTLSYFLEVYVPETPLSQTFKLLETLEGTEKPPYTEAGVTTFDGAFFPIEELLDSYLEMVRPDFEQVGIKACPKMVMPFYIKSRISPINIVAQSGIAHVLKGGISVEDFAGYRDDFFTAYLGQNKKFLTQQPQRKEVVMNQPEFLYLLTNFRPCPNLLRLRYQVFYEDGTSEKFASAITGDISLWNVYCFAVGPKQLGIDLLPKKVLQYNVWVNEENNFRISEIRRYVLDYRYYANSRFVLFNNSLGGYDTIHFKGEDSEVLSSKIELGKRQLGARYMADEAETFVSNNVGEREITLFTGWYDTMAIENADYLQELILSEDVMIQTDRSWVSLILKTNSTLYKKANETMVARAFSFMYASQQPNFSRLPIHSNIPARPIAWRVVAGSGYCELDDFGVHTGRKGYAVLERVYTDVSPNVLVRPRQTKPNDVGTAGYVQPVIDSSC